eukprot:TRINITY_DN43740_c0_g1_i1.p1 TRINITY_DN43740_c0_g1~~TRINITY_DN43740_c0_g1_i1.p1  ORF type:complete len:1247 (+),score=181.37 TRINITY_DN43740_c0_g1_i1:161-3901(+)
MSVQRRQSVDSSDLVARLSSGYGPFSKRALVSSSNADRVFGDWGVRYDAARETSAFATAPPSWQSAVSTSAVLSEHPFCNSNPVANAVSGPQLFSARDRSSDIPTRASPLGVFPSRTLSAYVRNASPVQLSGGQAQGLRLSGSSASPTGSVEAAAARSPQAAVVSASCGQGVSKASLVHGATVMSSHPCVVQTRSPVEVSRSVSPPATGHVLSALRVASPTTFLSQELAESKSEIRELQLECAAARNIEHRQALLEFDIVALQPVQEELTSLEAIAQAAVERSAELAFAYQELREDRCGGALFHADHKRVERLDRLEEELRRLLPLEAALPVAAEELEEAQRRERRISEELTLSELLAREATARNLNACEELVSIRGTSEGGNSTSLRSELECSRGELVEFRDALERLGEEYACECEEVRRERSLSSRMGRASAVDSGSFTEEHVLAEANARSLEAFDRAEALARWEADTCMMLQEELALSEDAQRRTREELRGDLDGGNVCQRGSCPSSGTSREEPASRSPASAPTGAVFASEASVAKIGQTGAASFAAWDDAYNAEQAGVSGTTAADLTAGWSGTASAWGYAEHAGGCGESGTPSFVLCGDGWGSAPVTSAQASVAGAEAVAVSDFAATGGFDAYTGMDDDSGQSDSQGSYVAVDAAEARRFVDYGAACRLHPLYDDPKITPVTRAAWESLSTAERDAHANFHLNPQVDLSRLEDAVQRHSLTAPTLFESRLGLPKPTEKQGRKPVALVVWGGIAAGKTGATDAALEALDLKGDSSVATALVEDMLELIPEYRSAVVPQHGDVRRETYMYAYMDCWALASRMLKAYHELVASRQLSVIAEPASGKELVDFAQGDAGPFGGNYSSALVFVDERDVERAERGAEARALATGLWTGPWTKTSYNQHLSLRFLAAARGLLLRSLPARIFVFTRSEKLADDEKDNQGILREVGARLARAPFSKRADTLVKEAVVAGLRLQAESYWVEVDGSQREPLDCLEAKARALVDEMLHADVSREELVSKGHAQQQTQRQRSVSWGEELNGEGCRNDGNSVGGSRHNSPWSSSLAARPVPVSHGKAWGNNGNALASGCGGGDKGQRGRHSPWGPSPCASPGVSTRGTDADDYPWSCLNQKDDSRSGAGASLLTLPSRCAQPNHSVSCPAKSNPQLQTWPRHKPPSPWAKCATESATDCGGAAASAAAMAAAAAAPAVDSRRAPQAVRSAVLPCASGRSNPREDKSSCRFSPLNPWA